MSEEIIQQTDGVDNRDAIDALASSFLKLVEEQNPTFEVLFSALAANVVGFSMQYVLAGLGEITEENMAEQLTRFQSYAANLGALKLQSVNAAIAAQSQDTAP